MLCLPLDSRQSAYAFNQPLSFNTSHVPDMRYMLHVRSTPARATHSPVGPTLRVTNAPAPTPSRLLARLPPSWPASTLLRFACRPLPMPPFGLGSTRQRSTSR